MRTRRRHIPTLPCQNRAYVRPQCTPITIPTPPCFGRARQPSRSSSPLTRRRRQLPRLTLPLTRHTRLLTSPPLHHRLFRHTMPTNTLLRSHQCRVFPRHSFLVLRSSCTSRSPDAAFPSSPSPRSPLRRPRTSHKRLLISSGLPLQPYRPSNCNFRPHTTFA